MGSDSDGDDYESLTALVAVAIATFAKHKRHTLLPATRICRGRGQPPSATRRWYTRSTGDRGKTTLLAWSAHGVFSLAPPTKLHLRVRWDALVERTRSSMYVVERSAWLIIFRENFVNKKSVNSAFVIRVVDPISPVWFRRPKMKLVFCFRYAILRDGLTPRKRHFLVFFIIFQNKVLLLLFNGTNLKACPIAQIRSLLQNANSILYLHVSTSLN